MAGTTRCSSSGVASMTKGVIEKQDIVLKCWDPTEAHRSYLYWQHLRRNHKPRLSNMIARAVREALPQFGPHCGKEAWSTCPRVCWPGLFPEAHRAKPEAWPRYPLHT
jgi:hypothetical protein